VEEHKTRENVSLVTGLGRLKGGLPQTRVQVNSLPL